LGSDIVVDAAATTSIASKSDDDKAQKAKKCTQLQATKNWQELIGCAKGLDALGAKDRAKEFQAKALKEQTNEFIAKDVASALRDRNLRQAEILLAKIGAGSIYYKDLHDQFLKQENVAIEDVERKAQGFATARDCATLKRYVAQQVSVSTKRVDATLQAVRCTEKAQTPDSPGIKQPNGNNSGTGGAPLIAGTPPKNLCDAMDVDDVMRQAANLHSAGYAKLALALVVKGLECKQNVLMYQMAGVYACTAHDLASAKTYFAKLSPNNQAALAERCQQEGLNLRDQ
ncbi:MAG TPA: hypothetical protein VHN14_35935, partial [Kofleriaceae bacterium]|nr:hypothetical protein [Kofleriaceae bacterium]